MSQTSPLKPLGTVLQQADLVSNTQIETALREQIRFKNRRLGEILVLKGWIEQKTADFFAERLPTLREHQSKQPLGQYLKEAALLSEEQILAILSEQKQTGLRFGELAVKKGWLKSTTIDFFLNFLGGRQLKNGQNLIVEEQNFSQSSEHLRTIQQRLVENQHCEPLRLLRLYRKILRHGEISAHDTPEQAELLKMGLAIKQQGKLRVSDRIYQSVFNRSWVEQELVRLQPFSQIRLKLFKLEEKASYPYSVLEEILDWTGEQFYLTQKLCQLIAESDVFIDAGEEAIQVEQLIRQRLLNNWQKQSAGEHLKTIQQRLLDNQRCEPMPLLRLYREILRHGEIPVAGTSEPVELLDMGLIREQQGKLSVANRIYEEVFNLCWVEQELWRLQSHRLQLELLTLKEKASYPYSVLEEILDWTEEQFYLTQKLCQLIAESDVFINAGEEATQVEQLVRQRLINNWQKQSAGEHLSKIQNHLRDNRHGEPLSLLRLYHRILRHEEIIADGIPEQIELLEIGLVKEQQGKLKVANRIYEEVFNLYWVEQELAQALRSSIAATKNTTQAMVISPLAPAIRTSEKPKTKNRILQRILLFGAIAGAILAVFYLFFQPQEPKVFQQGNELLNQGKYQQAIAKYDKVLASDANYYQAWTNRGYALAGLREYDKMLSSCTSATIVEPKAIYAWNCQGEALQNLKKYDEAIAAFDKAIAIEPNDPVFWINKSESLLGINRPQEAIATSDRAIEILKAIEQTHSSEPIGKELSIALNSKGRALRENQQYAEALEAYDRAIEYTPDYFPAQRGKGMILQSLGRYKEALSAFDRIIDNPNHSDRQKAEALFFKGMTLCDLQKPQEAVSAFEEALKLKPNYKEVEKANMTCGY